MVLVIINWVIKMNKKFGIFIIIALLILIGIGIYVYVKNTTTESPSSYEANKTATEQNTNNTNNQNSVENSSKTNSTNEASNTQANNQTNNQENASIPPESTAQNNQPSQALDKQIATYSTKIYSTDANRTKNMQITSNTLNETIVKAGTTFSFCNTVGPATSSKGYVEADIFDNNGNKKKGIGGGNCQISSTLYNAVLAVPNLVVTERHPHSNYVPYVAQGKDAAVAYGSYDLKFRNDTGKDVKIVSSVANGLVTITLFSN